MYHYCVRKRLIFLEALDEFAGSRDSEAWMIAFYLRQREEISLFVFFFGGMYETYVV